MSTIEIRVIYWNEVSLVPICTKGNWKEEGEDLKKHTSVYEKRKEGKNLLFHRER